MKGQVFHEGIDVVFAHGDDYLFSQETFGCHLNLRLQLWISFNNVVDLVNFLSVESWKCFLDLENVRHSGM